MKKINSQIYFPMLKLNIKKTAFYFLGLVFSVSLLSCEKQGEDIVEPSIEGKWKITSQEIFGSTVPGDGSYLKFDSCFDTICNGTDFKASDSTTGDFTYVLSEDETILEINDQDSDGGNYNYTWDILELSNSNLRMIANTALGTLKIEMIRKN